MSDTTNYLKDMTMCELKYLIKSLSLRKQMVKNYSKLKKPDLIDAIKDHVSVRKDGSQEYLVNKNHGRVDIKDRTKKVHEMKDKVEKVGSETGFIVKQEKETRSKVIPDDAEDEVQVEDEGVSFEDQVKRNKAKRLAKETKKNAKKKPVMPTPQPEPSSKKKAIVYKKK